jgi:hypothetical protein
MSDTTNATLSAALCKAQAAAKGVHKDGNNSFAKYKYASAEAIIREAQVHLQQAGLAVVALNTHLDVTGQVAEYGPLLIQRRIYRIIHEGGQHEDMKQDWPVLPQKGRPLDKAAAVADTASLSYFLRNLLLMARVEAGMDLNDPRVDDGPMRQKPTRAPESPDRRDVRHMANRPPSPREAAATPHNGGGGFEPMQPPQADGHHKSWAADRVRFCTWLTKQGWKYDDVRDWCIGIGEGKPSAWPQIGRDRFIADVGNWGPAFIEAAS